MSKEKTKKKKKNAWIYNVLLIIFLGIFLYCAWKIGYKYLQYWQADKEYESIRNEYVTKKGDKRYINFEKLRKKNPDIVGWIYAKGTRIDYPIVQGKDNKEYLHKTFRGKYNFAGTIFLDKDGKPDFTSQQNIIYGHHMRDGSMFASLMKFRDQAFIRKHDTVFIYTPGKKITLKVIASYAKSGRSKIVVSFGSKKNQIKYYQDILARSDINVKYKLDKKNVPNLFTLVTCSYEQDNYRTFVHGVQKKVELFN